MSVKSLVTAAILAATTVGSAYAADMPVKAFKAPAPVPFFLVNANSFSYAYYFKATDPGAGYTPKNVINFTHFDVWAYGTNFFTIDWLKSTNGTADGVFGCVAPNCVGATEIYGLARSTLGFNQLFNTKAFSVGPLTNVSLIWGGDLNTFNGGSRAAKRDIVVGLNFDFALMWKGTFSFAVEAYKEWNQFGFFQTAINDGSTNFNTTYRFEGLYVQPLGDLVKVPLTFSTLYGVNGPKGNGNVAGNASKLEYFIGPKLALDVGALAGWRPDMVSLFVGYRYWVNKFGADPNLTPFTKESTWTTGVTFAF
jgi:hypothetical protein